jgi:uncharacterized membrane protein YjjB (DUF3815 family)
VAAVPAIIDIRRQQTFMAAAPVIATLVATLAVGFASHLISRE